MNRRAIPFVRARKPGGSALNMELVLAGNGPGELSGWVRPVAKAAREIGPRDLRMTLALSPSQFAGGREGDVVKSWSLFDRIWTPAEGIRLALGLSRFEVNAQAAVVHLGGDLWFSAQLARRLRTPASAFVETRFVAHRHEPFALIFAASEDLAQSLRKYGVPAEKIVATGDPRVDAVLGGTKESPASENPSSRAIPVVSLLPGSRDRYVRALLPYLMRVADALHTRRPHVAFQIIAAEFLSLELLAEMRAEVSTRWPALDVEWITRDPWMALVRSHLALTFPGTSTAELAMLGVPFAAIVPLELVDRVPAEGLIEWIGRIPGVGRMIKHVAAGRYFARPRLMALPNQRAGRAIAPEWIGRWTPMELANRVSDLLDDEARRSAMRLTLRALYTTSSGAAARIARHALTLATAPRENRL